MVKLKSGTRFYLVLVLNGQPLAGEGWEGSDNSFLDSLDDAGVSWDAAVAALERMRAWVGPDGMGLGSEKTFDLGNGWKLNCTVIVHDPPGWAQP